MGLRAGIDIVEIADVEDSIRVHASRYLDRVFTASEQRDSSRQDGTPDPRRLATRFAAKEAAMKALGVGDTRLPWHSVALATDADGRPSLELSGDASRLASERGVSTLDVSLTDGGPYAAAVVVAHTVDRKVQ